MDVDKRYRAWCFTLQTDASYSTEVFADLPCKYLIAGREVAPTTGQHHWQGFVYFDSAKSFRAVQHDLPGAHIEKADHNGKAINYCRKEDKHPFEKGARPQGSSNKHRKDDYAEIVEYARAGKLDAIADIAPSAFVQQYRNLKSIALDNKSPNDTLTSLDNYFLYGPTGTGKSHHARVLLFPGEPRYIKTAGTKWWDGYDGESIIVIEELSSSKDLSADLLKQWADKWTCSPEFKGGTFKSIRPRCVIITSNFKLEDIYPDDRDHRPLMRRLKRYHLCVEYDPSNPLSGTLPSPLGTFDPSP